MINDRELLELAAKAAGIEIEERYKEPAQFKGLLKKPWKEWNNVGFWNPLRVDGDALRLAATLKADVKYHDGGVSAYIEGCQQGQFEDIGDDLYAATRRAIVRAAAEIGRNMT